MPSGLENDRTAQKALLVSSFVFTRSIGLNSMLFFADFIVCSPRTFSRHRNV
ncbi:hypothetical protein RBSH_03039 [Rhodopirellula baltica SH28]|uniref:Uncharacterized protein n=1 Tax=Rhodopirellula baltica SH28 TaxID=993517 RepID=K5CD86_RHOBT|nr:hypothetical protein RBSH_03039 [Rhodopirellula baltica SH28]